MLWLSLSNIAYLGFKVDITKAFTSFILYDHFYAVQGFFRIDAGNKRFSFHFRFAFDMIRSYYCASHVASRATCCLSVLARHSSWSTVSFSNVFGGETQNISVLKF